MCTQSIVHTMLKDTAPFLFPSRCSHRVYTPAFKAEPVAACQQPGVFIAAFATQHRINANVLHCWLKEYEHLGRHRWAAQATAFVPLQLSAPTPPPTSQASPTSPILTSAYPTINVQIHRGGIGRTLLWPVSATTELAQWTGAVVK